ncbi:hypothetical protein LCGC14_2374870, partial [marine sediment metagenome]
FCIVCGTSTRKIPRRRIAKKEPTKKEIRNKNKKSKFKIPDKFAIPDVSCLILPEKDEYHGAKNPYHQVNAVKYLETHYPIYVKKKFGAKGRVQYFPADKREDGIYDLLHDEKDEILSFIFETQPNLTKIEGRKVDKRVILRHCPEKAEGQYFLMPETFAIYEDVPNRNLYYRLVSAIPEIISDDRALKHTVEFRKNLDMLIRMQYNDSSIKFSLTSDVQEFISKQETLLYTNSVLGAINGLNTRLAGLENGIHTRFDSLEEKLYPMLDEIINKMPESKVFVNAAYAGSGLKKYLDSNKEVLKAIQKLTKKTKNVEKAVELLADRALAKELQYSINLEGGTEDRETYIVGRPFNAEIAINPKIKIEVGKVESTLPINSAWYGEKEKEIKKNKAYIKEDLAPGMQCTIELEINPPKQVKPLILKIHCRAKMSGEYYPVTIITQTLPIKVGRIKWIKIKKALKTALKKGVGFVIPKISDRVKALVEL